MKDSKVTLNRKAVKALLERKRADYRELQRLLRQNHRERFMLWAALKA